MQTNPTNKQTPKEKQTKNPITKPFQGLCIQNTNKHRNGNFKEKRNHFQLNSSNLNALLLPDKVQTLQPSCPEMKLKKLTLADSLGLAELLH